MKQWFKAFIIIIIISGNLLCGEDIFPPNSDKIIPALNFKNADIHDVLRSIAYEYQTNIVIDNQISQKVTVALFEIKVSDAIKIIAEDNNFSFSYDNQRFFVRLQKKEIPAPPPPKPEPEPVVNYIKGRLDISLLNNDINKVVDKLKTATGKNYLITSGTSGRLTGSLSGIELETGLRNILQNNGFYLTVKDSIFYISRSAYFSSLDNSTETNQRAPYWVSAKHNRVTLDVKQISLDIILDDLSRQLNLQIIKLASPNNPVTIKCSEVTLETAFEYLFKGSEFTYRKDGGAYIIGTKNANMNNTELIRLKYLRADKIKETLPVSVTQSVSVSLSLEHNALIVSGLSDDVLNFRDYIETIDQPVPQVLIEALVVDYNLDKIFQLGINAGRGDSAYINRPGKFYPSVDATVSGRRLNQFLERTGTLNLFGKELNVTKLAKLPEDFFLNIKALEQHGAANVRSKPILSSLNGHTASLKIGTVQNYVFSEIMPVTNQLNSTFLERERIEKIEASISFEITPWIGPNNELTLEIKPDFQTPIGQFVPDKKLIPAINTRSFLSTVRLRDGETIVLGGLIQESEINQEDKFPILGDIPILGRLFTNIDKKKSKGELIIYITPKIQYGDDFGSIYYDYGQ